ncbi:MAG: FliM/FliN family flagellar motor switch protein [Acidimicrobiales bacterium]|nr:FliM/FliN family flagellar motor switch protein [Acidimicrobiales bacterium]
MEPYDFSVRRPLDQQAAGAIRESLTAVAVRSALVLTALLRRPVTGTCGDLAEPAPGSVTSSDRMLLRFGDLILAPERSTVTGLAEIFMGAPATKPDRAPTSLEVAILLPRLSDVLYDLPTALGHPAGGTLRQAEPETARQLGVMVLAPFTLVIDPISYELPLVLPRSMVEGDELAAVTHQGGIEQAVAQVPLELEVAFEPLRVPALDIEGLEVGDVLRLDHRQEVPLTGLVGGRPLVRVVPGRPGRHLTVEVTDVLHGEYAS